MCVGVLCGVFVCRSCVGVDSSSSKVDVMIPRYLSRYLS